MMLTGRLIFVVRVWVRLFAILLCLQTCSSCLPSRSRSQNEGKDWFWYVDKTVSLEGVEGIQ